HLFNDHERAEVVKIRFAASGRPGRAHCAIDVETGAEDRRITESSGNLPGQATGRSDATDFTFSVDAVAVDRAVQVLFPEQTLGQHLQRRAMSGFGSLLRIEIVRGIDKPLPF